MTAPPPPRYTRVVPSLLRSRSVALPLASRSGGALAAPLALAWLLFSASPAAAYEDRLTLGPVAGVNVLSKPNLASVGATGALGGVALSVGIDDVWTARFAAGAALHPGDTAAVAVLGAGELLYTVDIVDWVPFFGVGVDTFALFAGGASRFEPGFHGVFGLDRWLSPGLIAGIDVRAILLPFAEGRDAPGPGPVLITVNLRLDWVFEL